MAVQYHLHSNEWLKTPKGEPRGYIDFNSLKELWFHTGTNCNLSCPFCLEGSKPGDNRLNKMTLTDVTPYIDEALTLGVEQFSFTGGEPFTVKDFPRMLDYALNHRPCLVLTNATLPLAQRLDDMLPLLQKKYPVRFRISFDYPDPERHNEGRGQGNFELAMTTMKKLVDLGFEVSIARQIEKDENEDEVNRQYVAHFKRYHIPEEIRMVGFPDFLPPGSLGDVPHITQDCMTKYHTPKSLNQFMCAFSRMVVKKDGQMRIYACTLVDDDEDYDLGASLTQAVQLAVTMKHHRCYSCFACGASCSEL